MAISGMSDLRLDCLRIAHALAIAKIISPQEVLPRAKEFYRWVDTGEDEKPSTESMEKLGAKYRR